MGRPRKHADDAAKMAAFRARWRVLSIRLQKDTADTIDRLCEFTDESQSEVVSSLIKFALNNRPWFTVGLYGRRMRAEEPRPDFKGIGED